MRVLKGMEFYSIDLQKHCALPEVIHEILLIIKLRVNWQEREGI